MHEQQQARLPTSRTRSSTRVASSHASQSASVPTLLPRHVAAAVAQSAPSHPLPSVAATATRHSHASSCSDHPSISMMQQQQQQLDHYIVADDETHSSCSSSGSADGYDLQQQQQQYAPNYVDSYSHALEPSTLQHTPALGGFSNATAVNTWPTATSAHAVASSSNNSNHSSGFSLAATSRKSYKPRKATHVVRREEKEELERQLEQLRAELLGLKYRAMFPHIHNSNNSSSNDDDAAMPLNPTSTGDVLRDAIKLQQLSLASVQAVLSNYIQQHKVSPIHTPIRLMRDPLARKATLQALKDAKIAEARRFLTERTRGMDMTRAFFEEERFETDANDFCVMQFEVTPLRNTSSSVKELFDVLFYVIFNLEIKISEVLGQITVREDDESGDEHISHHRLVSNLSNGVATETSTVHFSDFSAACNAPQEGRRNRSRSSEDLGSGLIVADFVDDDELYPYRPTERVRHDLTAVLTITPERRPRQTQQQSRKMDVTDAPMAALGTAHGNDSDDEEIVVTLTRWMVVKAHRPQFHVADDTLEWMRARLGSWTDELVKAVRQKAASSSSSSSNSSASRARR